MDGYDIAIRYKGHRHGVSLAVPRHADGPYVAGGIKDSRVKRAAGKPCRSHYAIFNNI